MNKAPGWGFGMGGKPAHQPESVPAFASEKMAVLVKVKGKVCCDVGTERR